MLTKPYNRTILELKLLEMEWNDLCGDSYNRTILELKPT